MTESSKRTAVLTAMGEKGAVACVRSEHQDAEMEEVKSEDSLDSETLSKTTTKPHNRCGGTHL